MKWPVLAIKYLLLSPPSLQCLHLNPGEAGLSPSSREDARERILDLFDDRTQNISLTAAGLITKQGVTSSSLVRASSLSQLTLHDDFKGNNTLQEYSLVRKQEENKSESLTLKGRPGRGPFLLFW